VGKSAEDLTCEDIELASSHIMGSGLKGASPLQVLKLVRDGNEAIAAALDAEVVDKVRAIFTTKKLAGILAQ
jgi:hypothetical protein